MHACILVDYGSYPQHWLLFDRLVQQVVLQTSQSSQSNSEGTEIEDNDPIAPLSNLNVKEIVHQLGKESEISDLRLRAEELEKENIELATKLSTKEQVTWTLQICHPQSKILKRILLIIQYKISV